jgi:hypothetical protein
MINIEFIKSPDDNVKTSFKFMQNELYLGRSEGNLRIQDSELLPSHLMLEVHENDFILHPQKEVLSYLINGKRATSIRKIKTNDVITIGKTEFKILEFSFTPPLTKKMILDKKLAELITTESSRLPAIEKLTLLMKEHV